MLLVGFFSRVLPGWFWLLTLAVLRLLPQVPCWEVVAVPFFFKCLWHGRAGQGMGTLNPCGRVGPEAPSGGATDPPPAWMSFAIV